MGKATRWLRCLLSRRKDFEDKKDNASSSSLDSRDKKRWSFCKTRQTFAGGGSSRSPASEQSWARPGYDINEEDKHAIAVAVAAAAAADAAVTAAKMAMVRLKSFNRESTSSYVSSWAAIRIQTAFRGYLARKALRALKALVKLQAVIRGHLVRKKAAATLQQLQALIRAQTFSQAQRSRHSTEEGRRWNPEFYPRRSFERSKRNGFERSPKFVEMDTCKPKSRSFRATSLYNLHPLDDSPTSPFSSLLPHKLPPRLSIPSHRASFHDYKWSLSSEGGRLYARTAVTAHNTPRFTPVATSAKGLSATDVAMRHISTRTSSPNYMTSTRSFDAKVRSQSAPKHRPETPKHRPETPRLKKMAPANETLEESRASLSGSGMRGSFSQMREACNLKGGRVGKIEKSSEVSRELARDYYLDTMW